MDKKELRERVDQLFQATKTDTSRHLKELKFLLKEAEKLEDIYIVGKLNMKLSLCWFDLGNRTAILAPAVKAVDIFEKLNDRNMLARSCNLLGLAYRALGNYQIAIENYNRAIDALRGLKRVAIRRDVMRNNIGECYYLMGEYHKSVRILKECYAVLRQRAPFDHVNAAIYAINLSDDYESLGEYDKAIAMLDEIKPDIELLARDVLLWGYYGRRCCVLYKMGRLEEAEKYADLTITSINSGYDSYEFHRDFEKISTLEVQNGDYRRAQCFADILNAYAETNPHKLDQIIAKRVQARICDARGESERALALYRELNMLYVERMREQIEMQYESQKNAEAASREIGKLLQRVRVSEEKAERDPLTGLMNRSALVATTNEFIESAKENGITLGAIFIDIDYFKEYNDTYGHAAGDEAIKYVARVCLDEESTTVRFFRYGGDEYFGIILDHKDEELEQLGLRILEKAHTSGLEHAKNPNGQRLTLSIGLVNVNMQNSNDTILDVINYADKTLYHAKDRGKNAVFMYHALENSEHEFRRIQAK